VHTGGQDCVLCVVGLGPRLDVPDRLVLPAAVEVAALRTAVEATTNVARHASASRVTMSIHATDDVLTVEVTDDGAAASPWQPGVGLTAMRERAEELGGSLTAGPTAGGGRVVATYPLMRPR
jgi:signal transduction histidine kinase